MKTSTSIKIEEQYNDSLHFVPTYNVNYLVTFPNEFGAYGEDFIELTGFLKINHRGNYEFEVSYFADEAEQSFYDDNSKMIEEEILNEFYKG
jgi:hypothetical protein